MASCPENVIEIQELAELWLPKVKSLGGGGVIIWSSAFIWRDMVHDSSLKCYCGGHSIDIKVVPQTWYDSFCSVYQAPSLSIP